MDAHTFQRKLAKLERFLGFKLDFIPDYYHSVLDIDELGTREVAFSTGKTQKTAYRWFHEGLTIGENTIYLKPISTKPYKTTGLYLKEFQLKTGDWRLFSRKLIRGKTLVDWFTDIDDLIEIKEAL
ncbi:hypothetical protein EDM52_23980 [Brevibacillus invocatus]|uniref:Uncharacterized protein n=1 Tax=Brevibacillus invocatus TaxID=173959 RepID=A0A3M8BNJ5_9BACL|nr:hypothetical protein [Brevibacillus invocatus]RNB64884.1 hypothetical protein EDM52_23980 [Brevibacillus invocatus]